ADRTSMPIRDRIERNTHRKSGVDTAAFGWLAWLVPFYLWRRAKALGQKPAYFWVWLVMLILVLLTA
ncbi:hypothetical protein A4L15_22985, partial [Salmonella enterica subsp. enterica serovar Typhimurium]|nr:hypothetical protein [Salmonella enterica subsp. enterica serovar Typhimurium]EDA8525987.1 hypothetical protein [Salmonella enterica subsp. enterica serovar Typhimurium]EDA8631569.1 hypothetical protein [Salmonella enterica subsp. enterica serovar Typhimurium]